MERYNKKHKCKKILIVLLGISALFTISFGVNRIYLFVTTPDEYMITTDNYFDYQKRCECSGYASAYVLRSQGEDVNGLELYNQFTDKYADGTLGAIYLCKNLNNMGYECGLHIGSVLDLKNAVSVEYRCFYDRAYIP